METVRFKKKHSVNENNPDGFIVDIHFENLLSIFENDPEWERILEEKTSNQTLEGSNRNRKEEFRQHFQKNISTISEEEINEFLNYNNIPYTSDQKLADKKKIVTEYLK